MVELYLFPIKLGSKTLLIDAKTLEVIKYRDDLVKHIFNIRKKNGELASKSIRIHKDSKLGLSGSVTIHKGQIIQYKIAKLDKTDLLKVKVEVNGSINAPLFETNILNIIDILQKRLGRENLFTTEEASKIIKNATVINNSEQEENKENLEENKENLEENKENSLDIKELINKIMELTLENNKLTTENRNLTAELESTHKELINTVAIYNGITNEDEEVLGVEDVYTHNTNTTPYRIDKYFAETLLKTMREFDRHTFDYNDYTYFNEIKCFPAYTSSNNGKEYEQIVQLKIPGNSTESLIALVTVNNQNPVSVIALSTFKKYEINNDFLRKLDTSYRRYRTSAINEAARSFM